MFCLLIESRFAAFRPFITGSFRPTAPFITPSAAYGLLLNLAGIEMREDDGKSAMTLIKKSGLPGDGYRVGRSGCQQAVEMGSVARERRAVGFSGHAATLSTVAQLPRWKTRRGARSSYKGKQIQHHARSPLFSFQPAGGCVLSELPAGRHWGTRPQRFAGRDQAGIWPTFPG